MKGGRAMNAKEWEAMDSLINDLTETHQEEMDTEHGGDGEEGCTYCLDIAAARVLLGEGV
jgi:hypothetical protein